MPDKLRLQSLVGLALAIAAGILLSRVVLGTYNWAWEQGYTSAFWIAIASLAGLFAAIWLVRRFRHQLRAAFSGRRALALGTLAFFAVLSYAAGVSLEIHRRAATASQRETVRRMLEDGSLRNMPEGVTAKQFRDLETSNPLLAWQLVDEAMRTAPHR